MKTFSLDFETYYDASCSIRTLGTDGYIDHPDFDSYLLSIYGKDFAWVGHPTEAPWDLIDGHRWVSHNRSFDERVFRRVGYESKGPAEWHCTADLAAYHGIPRSLAVSSAFLLGAKVSKDVRGQMKGQRWEEMTPDFKAEVAQYALGDSKYSYELWEKCGDSWPEWERALSQETSRMSWAGMPIDVDRMDEGISRLGNFIDQARESLPWVEEGDAPLSSLAWAKWVRSRGLDPTESAAKTDPDALQFVEDHPEEGKVLQAMWDLRGSNALLKKIRTMKPRVREDGMCPFGLKYFGAMLTGRDAGDHKFNVQNMPKGDMYGVDLRSMIAAKPGHKILVADLSQIEARVIAWLAGDKEALAMAASGMDWYEAVARSMSLYQEEGWKDLRQNTMKPMSLGCQFGMGPDRFASVADVPLGRAQDLVRLFRRNNPKIEKLWGKLKRGAFQAAKSPDKEFVMALPSGRNLRYRDVQSKRGLSALMGRGQTMARQKLWHGLLAENATQALARDVFMDRILEVARRGILPILRVHDEGVFHIREEEVAEVSKEIHEVMTTPPEWIPDLPLGTEVEVMDCYRK